MAKKKESSQAVKKDYEAIVTERVGSNPDGSTKYNFKQGETIALTKKEAAALKKYIK